MSEKSHDLAAESEPLILSHEAQSRPAPTGPLVVIDERELDEPVDDAIRRIRSETSGARILVIDEESDPPAESGAVLQPRPAGRAAMLPARTHVLSKVEEAIQRVGTAWLHNEEIMAQWVGEAKALARELEHALAKTDLERIADQVRGLIEIGSWMEATLQESFHRARRAAEGMEPLNTAGLARDAARNVHRLHGQIDIHLPPIDGTCRVLGRAGAVYEAFQLALEAVAHRIGGRGTIRIEIEDGELYLLHRFCGVPQDAETLSEPPAFLADRLRHLVVGVHGGRIFRGPAAAGSDSDLVVALPRQGIEPGSGKAT